MRRGNNLAVLQGFPIDPAGDRASPPPARRNQQCRLRHAVGGVNAFGIEPIGREGGGEPVDRTRPDGLGSIQGDLPAREIDAVDLFGAVASDAEIECEVGAARDLRPIIVDRPQPAERALHEADRRHKDTQRSDIERLQRIQNEPHVVIERDPADVRRVSRIAEGNTDHL